MSTVKQTLSADELETVAEGVTEQYRVAGYVRTDGDGAEALDKAALHEAIYQAVREARVSTMTERSEKSLTKGTLAKRVWPNAPGAHDEWDDLDEIQQAVWEELVTQAWNPTNPNFSGPVQRLVGERERKSILIRAKTTIDGTPDQDIVYLTSAEELIFTDFVAPLKNSVRKAAEKLAKNAAMISTRNKELAAKAEREVDSGMKNAASLAKSTLALMSGASET